MHRFMTRPGRRALGMPFIGRVAVAAAAMRGRGMAMVFHRVARGSAIPGGVVPAVSGPTFRRQIESLCELGEVVSLTSLADAPADGRRPRFALTFDDDSVTHYDVVLPILRELDVTGTFFLCGRSLHGLGPPWFEILDALVLSSGVPEAAQRLGVPALDVKALARACANDPDLQRKLEEGDAAAPEQLAADRMRALADAGMTIGFHTLHHRVLTRLADDEVDAALVDGRAELEAVVGRPVRLFAYPHGAADRRVAERVLDAGYVAAWTGRARAIERGSDPYRLGRWEPGPLSPRDFVAGVAVNLNGWSRG